jgi:hypothetical protein
MPGECTTIPQWHWSTSPQDVINALLASSVPLARVDEVAVTTRELVANDVKAIAVTVPAPARVRYAGPGGDVACLKQTTTTIGTVAMAGALIGDNFLTSQPIGNLFVHAECLSNGTITIKARNPSGTVDSSYLSGVDCEVVKI